MNKIFIIIQREYITRVTRPAFWIATLLAPIGFLVLMVASVLISTYDNESTTVAILDESGLFKEYFKQNGIADATDGSVHFYIEETSFNDLESIIKSPNEKKKYQAIIRIPQNYNLNNPGNPVISCLYAERIGLEKKQFIIGRLNDMVKKQRMIANQISAETQDLLQKKVDVAFESLMNLNEKKGYDIAASIVGLLMAMAIYISIFFYGTMIMKGVQEEKTSRIVEVLTSSVKPFQLLMGKIMGVGAVGMTQFVLWIFLIFLINIFVAPLLGITLANQTTTIHTASANDIDTDSAALLIQNLSQLPFTQIMILFPLYFLGGFLLYGSLFAAVGAAMGEDGDQQSLMLPVSVPIVISVFIAMNVMNNPDSAMGFWGSLIPFTSPVVMSALLPFHQPWWHITLSLLLLIAGFVFTTFIAAKIYRIGILMYGKKITFKEMIKWIIAKN
ncbi:MAG: ABC transporter permease [Chitinophagales bacterium]|nr:ABC transporter permease [Chitinophagales bacterium]